MAKDKKISVNAFEKVMQTTYSPSETFDWNGIEITVKRNLSLKEMLEFVDKVVKSCFTKSANTYMPEVKDFAIKSCILEKYANFNMPRNIDLQYDLIYCTDAVDHVLKYVNRAQFREILDSINSKINNIAQANISAVNKQMNELFSAFDRLQSKLEGIFSEVKTEDIHAIAGAISDGVLNERNLVKAYMKESANKTGAQ